MWSLGDILVYRSHVCFTPGLADVAQTPAGQEHGGTSGCRERNGLSGCSGPRARKRDISAFFGAVSWSIPMPDCRVELIRESKGRHASYPRYFRGVLDGTRHERCGANRSRSSTPLLAQARASERVVWLGAFTYWGAETAGNAQTPHLQALSALRALSAGQS